jgi:hypothetical protein
MRLKIPLVFWFAQELMTLTGGIPQPVLVAIDTRLRNWLHVGFDECHLTVWQVVSLCSQSHCYLIAGAS